MHPLLQRARDLVVERLIAFVEADPDLAPPPPAPPPVRRSVSVWSEETPNPHALKFNASVKVIPEGVLSLTDPTAAQSYPLGKALFALPGVEAVFATGSFVTVTKRVDASWRNLEDDVERTLIDILGVA